MTSLSEQLLLTTVRLEGGYGYGNSSVGTGFFFRYEDRIFLVTNKHVINGVVNGEFIMNKADNQGNPIPDERLTVSFNASNFIGHPDPDIDVTVMNLSEVINQFNNRGLTPLYRTISEDVIPKDADLENFVSTIEEIIFIGYPSGLWDSKNNLPITRKGITATPYLSDFMGEPKFLIDASVFPGSSGSPVFIYYSGGYPDKEGNLYAGNRIFFLGIVAQVFQRTEQGEITVKNIPTNSVPVVEIKQMIDLGIVFKSSTIIETMKHYLETVGNRQS